MVRGGKSSVGKTAKGKGPGKGKKKGRKRPEPQPEHVNFEDMEPEVRVRKPDDQIQLTEKELGEEFTQALTADDPNVLKETVKFSFGDGEFKFDTVKSHLAVHFSMDGTIIHVDDEEAVKDAQQGTEGDQKADDADDELKDGENITDAPNEENSGTEEKQQQEEPENGDQNNSRGGNCSTGEGGDDDNDEEEEDDQLTLKNQFNFSERASQTFNDPMRSRGVITEPPPTSNYGATANQWTIYDAYLQMVLKQMEAKQLKDKKGKGDESRETKEDPIDHNLDLDINERVLNSVSMLKAVKMMERVVNQNAQQTIFDDFKYFKDESDAQREDGHGFFLPLWRFSYEKTSKKTITAIKWNPKFTDLFAVGYGSYEFSKQTGGLICCYSLKNTSHPEYVFKTSSGVMCLDFHPSHPALLAVGMYDGTVAVFDVHSKSTEPIYYSSNPKCRHTDPVWQVRWNTKEIGKDVNFFSISSDGRVANWIMSKNELVYEKVMTLTLEEDDVPTSSNGNGDDLGENLVNTSGGICFDFNQKMDHLFIVGTEDGKVHKCSKAYAQQYLQTYKGHNMAVYAVKWNQFHPRVFLSASHDWTIKLWDHNVSECVTSFDLNTSVGDVAWSPYSSTVFAGVTSDGKVHLYDLSVSKNEALAEQRVIKKGKLTHVSFNPVEPVLLVGDDRGVVHCLKLSPNLCKMSAASISKIDVESEESKLQKILDVTGPTSKGQKQKGKLTLT